MTSEEAAILMIGGVGGNSAAPAYRVADKITYKDSGTSGGIIEEEYGTGEDKKTCQVRITFQNKGTMNEQITGLTFFDENGSQLGNTSFDGFYVG